MFPVLSLPGATSPLDCLRRPLRRFVKEEEGATTVDWVVLTGAVIGLSLAAGQPILSAMTPQAENIGSTLSDAQLSLDFSY